MNDYSKNILITGSKGFIGRNLCSYIQSNTNYKIFEFGRDSLFREIENVIAEIDIIFHLAGINKAKNNDSFQKGNVSLTKKICEVIKKNRKTKLYYASSTHASKDTEYGKSKKSGEQICLNLQKEFQNKVFILRLPGIFGNGCKPNYNSVVATFCYDVTTNKELKLFDLDKEIELVYVEDLCKQLIYSTTEDFKSETFLDIDNKYKIKISKLSKIIKGFKKLPIDQNPDDFSNPFIKKLFLTYRSYL